MLSPGLRVNLVRLFEQMLIFLGWGLVVQRLRVLGRHCQQIGRLLLHGLAIKLSAMKQGHGEKSWYATGERLHVMDLPLLMGWRMHTGVD